MNKNDKIILVSFIVSSAISAALAIVLKDYLANNTSPGYSALKSVAMGIRG